MGARKNKKIFCWTCSDLQKSMMKVIPKRPGPSKGEEMAGVRPKGLQEAKREGFICLSRVSIAGQKSPASENRRPGSDSVGVGGRGQGKGRQDAGVHNCKSASKKVTGHGTGRGGQANKRRQTVCWGRRCLIVLTGLWRTEYSGRKEAEEE